MSHSNSSLNCFANCMKKYEHSYILNTPSCKPPSVHLVFGSMAHEVLYNAGKLRDEFADKVSSEQYETIIPSEVLYNDLKAEFGIKSWDRYFKTVIKQCAKYEQELLKDIGECEIFREIKMSFTPEELRNYGVTGLEQSLVGIIDLLLLGKNSAIIIDYKFSGSRKSQDDFDMNSQLPLYAFFVSKKYGIPVRNIKVGYIDIPKQDFGQPTLLSNGTLSRSKSQNVSQELYELAVKAIHGENDQYYHCGEGGYYRDVWCNLALNKPAYMTVQYLDEDAYREILSDLFAAGKMIDYMKRNNMPFLKKYDAYTCKSCEYLNACKSWLNVGGSNEQKFI